jgi:hypothetical protein
VTLKRCVSPRNKQTMLHFSAFQKKIIRGVEKMEAALSGCHGIRAPSLFFSLL